MAPGKEWDDFFKVIGSFGIAKGEKCKFEEIFESN